VTVVVPCGVSSVRVALWASVHLTSATSPLVHLLTC
jgi:hypothetical protein